MTWSTGARIESPRLVLRAHAPTDLDDLVAFHGDEEVTRYTAWPVRDRAATAVALAERVGPRTVATGPGQVLSWAVEERATGTVVGEVLLVRTAGVPEVGYALRRDRWGRGLATEAVTALLGAARDRWSVTDVEALVDPANDASLRLLDRLGFRRAPEPREGLVVLRRTDPPTDPRSRP